MTRPINVLRKPLQLLAVGGTIITLATGCLVMEAPCQIGSGKGTFDFHGIAVKPRAYSHLKNTFDRRVVTPENDTLYQVIQPYDTLFGLELATTDNDTLDDLPTDPECKPYGYVHYIRSIDVVSNVGWDADHPAGTSLNDLIVLEVKKKSGNYLVARLSEVSFDEAFFLSTKMSTDNPFFSIFLLFPPPPRVGKHMFTVKVSKVNRFNGESFEVKTRPVTWN